MCLSFFKRSQIRAGYRPQLQPRCSFSFMDSGLDSRLTGARRSRRLDHFGAAGMRGRFSRQLRVTQSKEETEKCREVTKTNTRIKKNVRHSISKKDTKSVAFLKARPSVAPGPPLTLCTMVVKSRVAADTAREKTMNP